MKMNGALFNKPAVAVNTALVADLEEQLGRLENEVGRTQRQYNVENLY